MYGPTTPCEAWIAEEDLCCDVSGFDEELIPSAILAATQYLYDRTCRRWPGTCTATVRPCLPCRCPSLCCTCRYTFYKLPAPYPIIEITEVRVNGAIFAPTDYRLDNHRRIVLQDPNSLDRHCWPSQRLDVPDGADDSFEIDYTYGEAPLELAKVGAGDLACEILKACAGDDECVLPDGASSVTKRGITINFRGPADGFTNVKTADLLIAAYRCPDVAQSRIFDPADLLYADRT